MFVEQPEFSRKYGLQIASDDAIREVALKSSLPIDVGGKPDRWSRYCGSVRSRILDLLNVAKVKPPETADEITELIRQSLMDSSLPFDSQGRGPGQRGKNYQRFKDEN